MRARTAAVLAPAVLATSLTAVGGAQATPVTALTPARALPAATAPYRVGYDRDLRPAEGIRPNRTVFTADASGQGEQQFTAQNPNQPVDDHDAAFSPDGTQVAYVEDPDPDNTDAHDRYLVVANADGTNPRKLNGTVSASDLYGPTWSPDGSMIAYGVSNDGSSIQFVRVSDGSGMGFVAFQPFFNFADPAWSPSDPNTIVATAQGRAAQELVRLTVNISGDGVTVVALTVLDDTEPPFTSASGSACPSQQLAGLVIDTEGGPQVEDGFPAFTPDGGTIAFSGYSGLALCEVRVDGTGGHVVSLTGSAAPPPRTTVVNLPRVGSLAWAPDGSFLAAEMDTKNSDGFILSSQIWALTPAPDAQSAAAELYVNNAAAPTFDIQTGPVTLTVTADPTPGYVGGHTVDVTYKLDNQTGRTISAPKLVAALPAQLPLAAAVAPPCTPASCLLGDVGPRASVSVTFPLTPTQAVSALASGTVTFTDPQGAQQLLTGQAPIVVKQPVVIINPTVGPPGIVTVATGSSFPPGARVRFTWTPGITAPTVVRVRADGTFTKQVLVLPHDTLGPRTLTVHGFTGPTFGDLALPFLVVLGDPQPPRFFGRG